MSLHVSVTPFYCQVCIYHSVFIHLQSMDSEAVSHWATMNKAAVNIVQIFREQNISFWRVNTEMKWLADKISICLVL